MADSLGYFNTWRPFRRPPYFTIPQTPSLDLPLGTTTSYNHFTPSPENSTTKRYNHFDPRKSRLVAPSSSPKARAFQKIAVCLNAERQLNWEHGLRHTWECTHNKFDQSLHNIWQLAIPSTLIQSNDLRIGQLRIDWLCRAWEIILGGSAFCHSITDKSVMTLLASYRFVYCWNVLQGTVHT